MTLTLTILNAGSGLDNGLPAELVLDRSGALIGRSPNCDWCLPDPRNHISSRHCEIRFEGDSYLLHDISMNGTFLNDQPDRMARPHRLADGDVVTIGQYRIRAGLRHEAGVARGAPQNGGAASHWDGWGRAPAAPPSAPASGSAGWGAPPVAPAKRDNDSWAPVGAGSRSASEWTPAPAPAPAAAASTWDTPMPQQQSASGWSSAAPDRPPAPAPDDIWGRLAEGNVVDWSRGGFGQPIDVNPDPLGLRQRPTEESLGVAARSFAAPSAPAPTPIGATAADSHFAMPPVAGPDPAAASVWPSEASAPVAVAELPQAAPPVPQAPPQPPAAPPVPDTALVEAFLRAAGVDQRIAQRDPALVERAGRLFHRLVAGLVLMVEARARAKSQMGAESTAFEMGGNNPIKFARAPEDAIAALLEPPAPGFMESGQAIESAYFDLQSHQIATLRAMQGALRATLDRFSPTAIRQRAESRGLLARILPAARDAALWQAYEKEFGGVAAGSDEAFMDVFAKEFRRAYDEQSRAEKRGGR